MSLACVSLSVLLLQFLRGESRSLDCRSVAVGDPVTLQQAIDQLLVSLSTSTDGSGSYNCTSIELPAGEHVLWSQTLFPADLGSLVIRGPAEESASVVCVYEVAENNYTWYFSDLESLEISNIHFRDCSRPLRIDTVAEVEITNCSFR